MSSKVKIKDGFSYSMKPFKGYKFRAKINYHLIGEDYSHSFDIYTDNSSREKVEKIFFTALLKKYENLDDSQAFIIHWVTKKQDDLSAKFIESLNF